MGGDADRIAGGSVKTRRGRQRPAGSGGVAAGPAATAGPEHGSASGSIATVAGGAIAIAAAGDRRAVSAHARSVTNGTAEGAEADSAAAEGHRAGGFGEVAGGVNAQDQRRSSDLCDIAERSCARPLNLDVRRQMDKPNKTDQNKKTPFNQWVIWIWHFYAREESISAVRCLIQLASSKICALSLARLNGATILKY